MPPGQGWLYIWAPSSGSRAPNGPGPQRGPSTKGVRWWKNTCSSKQILRARRASCPLVVTHYYAPSITTLSISHTCLRIIHTTTLSEKKGPELVFMLMKNGGQISAQSSIFIWLSAMFMKKKYIVLIGVCIFLRLYVQQAIIVPRRSTQGDHLDICCYCYSWLKTCWPSTCLLHLLNHRHLRKFASCAWSYCCVIGCIYIYIEGDRTDTGPRPILACVFHL